MSGTINNGDRFEVTFGQTTALAGVTTRGGQMQVAIPNADLRALRKCGTGTVNGEAVRVLAVEPSKFIKGMAVLTVVPPAVPAP